MVTHEDDRFRLDRVAFYGRTLDEYARIFDLDVSALKDVTILDCPSGASSFVAEATQLGLRAAACDPMFGEDIGALSARGAADIEHVMQRLAPVAHLYKWDFYANVEQLREHRTRALKLFAEDYPNGIKDGRCVKGALPHLPFADRSFGLVLSGHFLFTYSDMFDFAFHDASVRELHRVCAKEVRIYPIQGPDSKPYPRMAALLDGLQRDGIPARIDPVPFEFQRGSNQMLRLRR